MAAPLSHWTEETAIEALRQFEREHGRKPNHDLEIHRSTAANLPGGHVLKRLFGSVANAWIMAYGDPPIKPTNIKDEDTEEVIRCLAGGATLAELARERGISGQALGRRVRRYQKVYGLRVVNRRPGAPRKTR